MKVCHFVTQYLPITQNWIYNQLIFNRECDSYVLCQNLVNPKLFPFENVFPICKHAGLLSYPTRALHKFFKQYPINAHGKVIEKIKPDILHGHFLFESWRNYELIKTLNIPLVTTCYGADISALPQKEGWLPRFAKVFEIGGAFMVEGSHMGNVLEKLGCPRKKIHVVKLGVDISKFDAIQNERSPYDDVVRILFCGLGREKKGAQYAAQAFISAVSQLPANTSIELHLLGDGVYRNVVKKMFKCAGVLSKVKFHGMLPVDKYHELLKTMDILLAPSVHAANGDTEGGAPVIVIEALASGIPVIGSNHCDIPNIVRHGNSGLLSDERDAFAMSHDICSLVLNEGLRKSMGKRGAEYARREHDIVKQTKKITEVYTSVNA